MQLEVPDSHSRENSSSLKISVCAFVHDNSRKYLSVLDGKGVIESLRGAKVSNNFQSQSLVQCRPRFVVHLGNSPSKSLRSLRMGNAKNSSHAAGLDTEFAAVFQKNDDCQGELDMFWFIFKQTQMQLHSWHCDTDPVSNGLNHLGGSRNADKSVDFCKCNFGQTHIHLMCF